MTEKQLQFRVGLFVVSALGVGAWLIIQFSDVRELWKRTYSLAIHFEEAPGLHPGSPVKQSGLTIGAVRSVRIDEEAGGVLVIVDVKENHKLRVDSRAQISRSLFGDSRIDFTSGKSDQTIPPLSRLEGIGAVDPMEIVGRMEGVVTQTVASFEATSQEWRLVAQNINELLDSNRDNLQTIVEQTTTTLAGFNRTMDEATRAFAEAGATLKTASDTLANANSLIADPQLQADLRRTAAALPQIADETHRTIAAARASMAQVSQNLESIQQATTPIAEHSDLIVRKLSGSLIQLESLLTELNTFSQVLNSKDGSLQRFASDPELYRNLNRSASASVVLLENLAPILNDVRVFTDKVARHPELLGISGAVRGSSGLKEANEVQPAGFSQPAATRNR